MDRVQSKFNEFLEGSEVGMGFAAYVDGELAYDLWGGESRPGTPWERDTLSVIFSATKGATALCVQILADRGLLDTDASVKQYWPEFRSEKVLVKHVLSHTAGMVIVPGFGDFITPPWDGLADVEEITRRLATAEPSWEPGTQLIYHALTYGWLIGEIVRRIDGRTVGAFFAEDVARPLGLDFYIGLPDSEFARLAPLIGTPTTEPTPEMQAMLDLIKPGTMWGESLFVTADCRSPLLELEDVFNRPAILRSESAAGGGVTTARDLARMYALLSVGGTLDGIELVSPESITKHRTEVFSQMGPLGVMQRYALGYAPYADAASLLGCSRSTFGHGGAGGTLGLADPERHVSVGFVHNQMHTLGDNANALVKAVYESI